jgi:hypothetical protein
MDHESVALNFERADDHERSAYDLAQPDHRGMAERRDRRHAQPLEGAETVLAAYCPAAEGIQMVREQNG